MTVGVYEYIILVSIDHPETKLCHLTSQWLLIDLILHPERKTLSLLTYRRMWLETDLNQDIAGLVTEEKWSQERQKQLSYIATYPDFTGR